MIELIVGISMLVALCYAVTILTIKRVCKLEEKLNKVERYDEHLLHNINMLYNRCNGLRDQYDALIKYLKIQFVDSKNELKEAHYEKVKGENK